MFDVWFDTAFGWEPACATHRAHLPNAIDSLGAAKRHQGDFARRPLIAAVGRGGFHQEVPQLRAFLPNGGRRAGGIGVAADLDPHVRVRSEIEIPGRITRRASVRGDHEPHIASVEVAEWNSVWQTGFPAESGQQQNRRRSNPPTDASARATIDAHHGAQEPPLHGRGTAARSGGR